MEMTVGRSGSDGEVGREPCANRPIRPGYHVRMDQSRVIDYIAVSMVDERAERRDDERQLTRSRI
jgi:hypothetical protein